MPPPRKPKRPTPPKNYPEQPLSTPKPKEAKKPWMPVDYTKADCVALVAMKNGTADAAQQKRAMEIILVICDRNGMSFRPGPDGQRDTDFAEGKRFVGNTIVKLANMDMRRFNRDGKPKEQP